MENLMTLQTGLLGMLADNQPLDTLMDYCENQLGNPIALLNAAYKPISVKMKETVLDFIWNTVMTGESANYTVSKYVRDVSNYMDIGRKIAFADEPFLFQNDEGRKSVIKRIVSQNKILGYFCCIEQEKFFDENILESVKIICNVLSVQLQKMDYFALSASKPKDDLMRKLLENKEHHLLPYRDVLDTILNQAKGNYYILAVPVSSADYSSRQIDNMCTQFTLADRECCSHAILYDGQIIVIICMKEEVFGQYFHIFSSYCSSHDVTGGMSESFQAAANFQKYYAQAVRAVTFAIYRPGKISLYREIQIYDLLSNIRPDVDVFDYYLDVVRKIKQYDDENSSDYLETLDLYLKFSGNITRVSQNMHTHRNTIVHRLNRLVQLFSCDLENGEERVRLFLSIRLLEMEAMQK